jgi:hypothetical protein
MTRRFLGAALLLLAALPGCDRMLNPVRSPLYAPWEEGLTLIYEDPRSHDRMQVRVAQSRSEGGEQTVTETYSTLSSNLEGRFRLKDGGVVLEAGGSAGIRLLPEGFPDRTSRWEARNRLYWVVGRATASLPGVRLGDPEDAVGVWVESCRQDGQGPRQRVLYLPNVGEAQTLEWSGGRWVETNRLVSRGFTDVPNRPQDKPSGSNP